MLEVLFSLRTVFYLAIVTVQPVMAEIDLETIVEIETRHALCAIRKE